MHLALQACWLMLKPGGQCSLRIFPSPIEAVRLFAGLFTREGGFEGG